MEDAKDCPYHNKYGQCEYISPLDYQIHTGCIYDLLIYTKMFQGVCQIRKTLDRRLEEDKRKS